MILNIVLISCNGTYTPWEYDVKFQGADFEKLRYSVVENDTNSVIGYLENDAFIQNIPCKAGWVHFKGKKIMTFFQLSKNFKLNNFEFKRGTWIFDIKEDYLVCILPEDTEIQGYLCRGGGGSKGIHTSIYDNGKLRGFFTAGTVIVDGIKCKGGLFSPIHLHRDGSLMRCDLAEDTIIGDTQFSSGTVVSFDKDGKAKNFYE
jgi:hypothetical protein